MFLSRNKKIDECPCKPQFYCIKVGFKWSKLYRHVYVMANGKRLVKRVVVDESTRHKWVKVSKYLG